jgi:hypothetical protein
MLGEYFSASFGSQLLTNDTGEDGKITVSENELSE